MSIKAMKQALEALLDTNASGVPAAHNDSAIEALNQAIAEAEKQEPVAWIDPKNLEWLARDPDNQIGAGLSARKRWDGLVPLYTHPQPNVEQEPVAYPEGDVVGPCVCGSWPGGKCLKCPRVQPQSRREPMTDDQKQKLIGNYFAEDWAQKSAKSLLDDYEIEAAYGIKE